MKYYIIRENMEHPDRCCLDDPIDTEGNKYEAREFELGENLPIVGNLRFKVLSGVQKSNIIFSISDAIVVSDDIGSALYKAAPREIQLLPATIDGNAGYYVLNAIKVIDCIIDNLSDLELNEPGERRKYFHVNNPVLNLNAIRSHKIFRLFNWELALVIREDIKNLLSSNNVQGVEYREVRTFIGK